MQIETVRPGIVLGMALAVCFTLPARAANVTFTILDTSSDTIAVSDDNQTGRLSFPGFPFTCTGVEGPSSPCFFSIFFPSGTNRFAISMGGTSASAVNLLESFSPFIVSDTLQQQDQTATSTLWEFFSDSETPLGSVPGPVLLETGAVQPTLVITYFNASNAVIGTDTLNIQSDAPEGVPEPATVVLGLSGLVLIGAWRLRASSTVMSPDRY